MYKPNKKTKTNKILLLIIIVAVIFATVGIVFFILKDEKVSTSQVDEPSPAVGEERLNLDPPTEADKIAVDQTKASIPNEENDKNSSSSTAVVNVVISDARQYGNSIEVRGFAGVVEDGGICTATFTKDELVLTKKVDAVADATTTLCPTIEVNRASFGKTGSWSVKLAYNSATSSGDVKTNIEVK